MIAGSSMMFRLMKLLEQFHQEFPVHVELTISTRNKKLVLTVSDQDDRSLRKRVEFQHLHDVVDWVREQMQ